LEIAKRITKCAQNLPVGSRLREFPGSAWNYGMIEKVLGLTGFNWLIRREGSGRRRAGPAFASLRPE
jgi:hypothetical protein